MEGVAEQYEIEAGSLDEARALARSRVPPGFKIISEAVLDPGGVRTVRGTGDTEDAAFARAQIPPLAEVRERRTTRSPSRVIHLSALGEPRARALAEQQAEPDESVARISVKAPGRQGFLGLGRTPSLYEVTFARPATVEVVIRTNARVRIILGRLPTKAELIEAIGKFVVQAETMRATYPGARSPAAGIGPLRQKLADQLTAIFNRHLNEAKAVFPHNAAIQELQPLGITSSAGGLAEIFDELSEALSRLVECVAWADEEPSDAAR